MQLGALKTKRALSPFLLFSVFVSTLCVAQEFPKSFQLANKKCPLKFKNTKTNKWENFKYALKDNLTLSEVEKISSQKSLIKFKIDSKPYSRFVFAGDFNCLSGKTSASSKSNNSSASQERFAKNNSNSFISHFRFARERTNYIDNETTRIEPLFNDLYYLGVGLELTPYSSGNFYFYASGLAAGGISKLSNADSTPTITITQSPSLVLGAEFNAGLGYSMSDLNFFLGVPTILRYQKFAASTEGTIEASSFKFIWATELGATYSIGESTKLRTSVGFLTLTLLNPTFTFGLNFNL